MRTKRMKQPQTPNANAKQLKSKLKKRNQYLTTIIKDECTNYCAWNLCEICKKPCSLFLFVCFRTPVIKASVLQSTTCNKLTQKTINVFSCSSWQSWNKHTFLFPLLPFFSFMPKPIRVLKDKVEKLASRPRRWKDQIFGLHNKIFRRKEAVCGCGRPLKPGWECPYCRRTCSTCQRALGEDEECTRCRSDTVNNNGDDDRRQRRSL